MTAQQATWGIAQPVRRALSRIVLEIRATLEDDFTRQLAAIGISRNGVQPAGRSLAPNDQRARDAVIATILREIEGGASHAEALESYVREAAFTFLNRIVGLRCLEERGLLIVDSQPETAIKVVPAFNTPSLYWRVRNDLSGSTNPREVWRETFHRACAAVSQQVRVLFDPNSEYAALLPLQPALQKITEAFNSPEIPFEIYAQDETLGWVYQYYNQEEKNQVYERLGKGKKIERPEELAAATCLYTERYMVDYLLQNTLGALWVEMHPDSKLPGQWPYYVRPPEGNPKPQRPVRRLREITVMDPACGSGHFLVRAFDLLAQMYSEEGLERREEIAHLILERNLHGIDIDLRAVQIAALALYLKGCALAGPDFKPRRLNLVSADAVLPGDTPPKEYMKRFKGDPEIEALVTGIWQGLRNVREFGSLLHPERAVDEVIRRRALADRQKYPMLQRGETEWARWKADLLHGLREEFEKQAQSQDLGQRLFGEEAAKGVSLVEALGGHYDVVVTNPPYQGSRSLNLGLKSFLEKEYKVGKRDLYTAFILRCRDFCQMNGYVGMVTQQSWMFLRSFAALREEVLGQSFVTTLAHLGPRAFEEIGGEIVNVALFTLCQTRPASEARTLAFRLVGPNSSMQKEHLLRQAIEGIAPVVVSTPYQAAFLRIPETPFVYWLRDRYLNQLGVGERLDAQIIGASGLGTRYDQRFTRCFWEVERFGKKWYPYAKGGGFKRWFGLNWLLVNYENDGQEIREYLNDKFPYLKGNVGILVRQTHLYCKPGLTYSDVACGSLSCRLLPPNSIFSDKGPGLFPREGNKEVFLAYLNSGFQSYMLRALSPTMEFPLGYVLSLPAFNTRNSSNSMLSHMAQSAISLKMLQIAGDPVELTHIDVNWPTLGALDKEDCISAMLVSIQGVIDRLISEVLHLNDKDIEAAVVEIGTPVGWSPLVTGYDSFIETPDGITMPNELRTSLEDHERLPLSFEELTNLKQRLSKLYKDGPAVNDNESEDDSQVEEEAEAVFGASNPIPTESFLEELSRKLGIHPTSVYWLLKEMREKEALVCPPELNRHLEDYVSVTMLRLLGYRWPEQDKYEREHGPIIDPSLVVDDGIIPLVPCGDQPTAAERVRRRLERDFGDEGASKSEAEFRQWAGRSIEDWLRRDFFRRHIQQFKQRPIAWHLVSPERTIEVFVLYHKLSRATLQKLRAQYAGGLITRFQAEQARAKVRGDMTGVSRLQIQIEDVEEFRSLIEAIERGEELQYRIRCRWKGEEETGRPGPYAPDIDDGVKVNIRPFQEAGLLAVKEVIKKW